VTCAKPAEPIEMLFAGCGFIWDKGRPVVKYSDSVP